MIFKLPHQLIDRHARATCVTIGLEKRVDGLVLTVEDNGRGITDREIANPSSIGLLDMRERALQLGRKLLITGAPEKGTSVTLTVPFNRPGSLKLAAAKAK